MLYEVITPWRVGYVEPSVRPDDGRYGENPNRMQLHYQYQVILKPDPGVITSYSIHYTKLYES